MQRFEPIEISELQLTASLPSLPTVALEVLRICQDPHSDIGDLAEALSRDPTLAGRVLQLANSAYYRRGDEVTSLNRAAVMLGLRALKVLALGFTLAHELPSRGSKGGFDLQLFWHRSLVSAVAGRSVAAAIGAAKQEEAFLCGLLSQIGKLALAQAAPERYSEAVESGGGWPSEELERDVLGFTSSEVGEVLLGQWRVPESIVVASSYAQRLDRLPGELDAEWRELAHVTALAVRAGDVLVGDESAASLQALNQDAAGFFGLRPDRVTEILGSLHDGVLETAGAFAVELPASDSYEEILDRARTELMAVTLNTVLDLERTTSALAELAEENEVLQARALTDELTQLANRTALQDALTREVHERLRQGEPVDALGVLMIDIDKFKELNDAYGHQHGDEILRAVALRMASVTRRADLLARYGGEEFCVVMPHTNHQGVEVAAERLRREDTRVTLPSGVELRVTVSVGAAAITDVSDTAIGDLLTEAADAALYRAKAKGRNRVEIAPEPATRSLGTTWRQLESSGTGR
jgi:diguanylate cyclase (GGDEF)-like protein